MRFTKEAAFACILCISIVAGVSIFLCYKNYFAAVHTAIQGDAATAALNQSQSDTQSDDVLSITAVGDISLGRGVGSRIVSLHGSDFTYCFGKVREYLNKADLTFGNLESPISDRGTPSTYKPINLRNSTKSFEAIKFAGFDILNLATNHMMDYGAQALFDTLDILKANGIAFAGAGENIEQARRPAIIEIKGRKIGMLAYTDMAYIRFSNSEDFPAARSDKPGVAPREEKIIKEDVEKLRDNVDILIVSFHWGIEESFAIANEQRQLAHELLDLGADMIIGHHPHQFQGIEIYKGKPIMYSLGNFLFDQNDPENQETFIVNMEYEGTTLKRLYAIPMRTIDKTQVVPQYGEAALPMLERQAYLSSELDTECEIVGDVLYYKKAHIN